MTPEAFWRTMKKIIPGNKSSGGSKNINIDGVLCSEASDGKKIANEEEEEEEEEPLLIYTSQGSPFRRKKLSVINGSPEQQRTKTTLNI